MPRICTTRKSWAKVQRRGDFQITYHIRGMIRFERADLITSDIGSFDGYVFIFDKDKLPEDWTNQEDYPKSVCQAEANCKVAVVIKNPNFAKKFSYFSSVSGSPIVIDHPIDEFLSKVDQVKNTPITIDGSSNNLVDKWVVRVLYRQVGWAPYGNMKPTFAKFTRVSGQPTQTTDVGSLEYSNISIISDGASFKKGGVKATGNGQMMNGSLRCGLSFVIGMLSIFAVLRNSVFSL